MRDDATQADFNRALKNKDMGKLIAAVNKGARAAPEQKILHDSLINCLDSDFFELLIAKAGADVNETLDGPKSTILMNAAWHKNIRLAQLLIGNGAKLNCQNDIGNTALHLAVWAGSPHDTPDSPAFAIVRMLLDAGADTTIENDRGRNVLELADFLIRPEMSRFLKDYMQAHDDRRQRRENALCKMEALSKRRRVQP